MKKKKRKNLFLIRLLFLIALAAGCSGSKFQMAYKNINTGKIASTKTETFQKINGLPDEVISNYLKKFDLPPPADLSMFSPDSSLGGLQTSRVRLLVNFQQTATVSQVNDLLREIDGHVIGVLDLAETFFIEIPDALNLSRIKNATRILNQKKSVVKSANPDVMIWNSKPNPQEINNN